MCVDPRPFFFYKASTVNVTSGRQTCSLTALSRAALRCALQDESECTDL